MQNAETVLEIILGDHWRAGCLETCTSGSAGGGWKRASLTHLASRLPDQLCSEFVDTPFEIDHISSLKHEGPTVAGNLALSCFRCNSYKGTDLAGRDPLTRKLTPLFNPRRHKWARHFR
jgi:hypothetical protein